MSKKEIKPPSTENIPDEYEIENASVHIFLPNDKRFQVLADTFKNAMSDCKFYVPNENVHRVRSKADIDQILVQASLKNDMSCLIIAFFGESVGNDIILENDEVIKITDISSPFIFGFRNKPRIFFMQSLRRLSNKPQKDSIGKLDSKYDAPLEADQLIIYNIDEPGDDINIFIENISYNIKNYGKRDNIFDIIMFAETSSKRRPLLVSTLRKKFYFKKSPYRGYDYEYNKNWEHLEIMTKKIRQRCYDTY